jgi:hypothetical protein
LFYVKNDLS